ncbi:MAG: hypothetical protein ACYC9S_12245, partial [Leptospirales bacterium]
MSRKDDVEVIGAFAAPGELSPLKKVPFWKKPFFVKGLIAGAILSVIVVFFVHERKSRVPHATSVPSAPPLPSSSGGVSKNPEYQRKISILNKEKAELAVRNGQSSVPTVGGDEKAGDIGREEKNAPPAAPPPPLPPVQNTASQTMESSRRAYDSARSVEVTSVD